MIRFAFLFFIAGIVAVILGQEQLFDLTPQTGKNLLCVLNTLATLCAMIGVTPKNLNQEI